MSPPSEPAQHPHWTSRRHPTCPRNKRKGGVSFRYLRAEHTNRINHTGTGSVFWSLLFADSCGGAPLAVIHQSSRDGGALPDHQEN